ncbi:MAG: leucine--tRNA ligase, partial [Actinobacteria bacterium]|nr:leucine--tRNA ligase [Actinomycetota bacterium]
AEELWHLLGHKETLAYEPWPLFNEEFLKEDLFDYPVSFNGKMRFKIELPVNMSKEEIIKIVLADERAKKWIRTTTPSNIIVVPNRIVNIVIKN